MGKKGLKAVPKRTGIKSKRPIRTPSPTEGSGMYQERAAPIAPRSVPTGKFPFKMSADTLKALTAEFEQYGLLHLDAGSWNCQVCKKDFTWHRRQTMVLHLVAKGHDIAACGSATWKSWPGSTERLALRDETREAKRKADHDNQPMPPSKKQALELRKSLNPNPNPNPVLDPDPGPSS